MVDKKGIDKLTEKIIGAAIKVHRALGPGLLESAYEACLLYELNEMGLKAKNQVPAPVIYERVKLDCGYRIDILVEDTVVVELKSAERMQPIYKAQLITHIKLAGKPAGLVINFNVKLLKNEIFRAVNNLEE